MPRSRPPYPREFREEATRAGPELGPAHRADRPGAWVAWGTLSAWVKQAELDAGLRSDGLTTAEGGVAAVAAGEPDPAGRAGDPEKSGRLLRSGDRVQAVEAFGFVEQERAHHRVARMCRVLGVSPSGYYAWRKRGLSRRRREDAALLERVRRIWEGSGRTYGAPRVWAELRACGVRCSRKRVARLMREAGLVGAYARRRRRGTTVQDPRAAAAPDLVGRQFRAEGPNRLWVADLVQVPTGEGWLYLGVILDVWHRGVVGWAMRQNARAELVVDALEMALWRRRPAPGLVHHSDRGAQYTSLRFGARLERAGMLRSMGSKGDAYDNALCEAFFATLHREVLSRCRFRTRDEARSVLFAYLEGFYNRRRRHSALGYLSPEEFERRWSANPESVSVTPSTKAG
jgi:putative transposase